jgi:hypothetical protein
MNNIKSKKISTLAVTTERPPANPNPLQPNEIKLKILNGYFGKHPTSLSMALGPKI